MAPKWFEFACSRNCGFVCIDMAKLIDHEAKCGRATMKTHDRASMRGRAVHGVARRRRADRPAA